MTPNTSILPAICQQKSTLPAALEGDRLLTFAEVAEITRYSRVHIRRLIRDGKFPAPVRLGAGKFLWRPDTIRALLHGEAVQ